MQLGCQTYATCFATSNEIIFYVRPVFKNVRDILIMSYCDWFLLKKLRDKLQWGCHAATCRVALQKVEAASTFSATCNAIFRYETSCKHGVSHEEVFLATCNATPLRCKLQRKLPRVTWPLEWVCTGRTSCHRLFSPYDFWLNNPIIKLEYVEILPRILLKAPYLHFNKI